MNVASLELCKELYELSGWDDGSLQDYYHLDKNGKGTAWRKEVDRTIPAYPLGFLLRKLPYKLPNTHINHWLTISMGAASAVAKYSDSELVKRGDTPEDAACKLAIELFKQGILK